MMSSFSLWPSYHRTTIAVEPEAPGKRGARWMG